MAFVYGTGVVFALLAIGLLLIDLGRILAGRIRDDELVMIKASDEAE